MQQRYSNYLTQQILNQDGNEMRDKLQTHDYSKGLPIRVSKGRPDSTQLRDKNNSVVSSITSPLNDQARPKPFSEQ
jgi:hypothetical protein